MGRKINTQRERKQQESTKSENYYIFVNVEQQINLLNKKREKIIIKKKDF